MNYVDIAIIAVIALFALIGILKGIGKTFIKFVCFALALVAAYFLADILLKLVLKVGFIRSLIVGSGKSLATVYFKSFDATLAAADAGTKITGILGFYVNPMIERFTAMGGAEAWGMTYARFISVNMALHTIYVGLFFISYVVARLIAVLIAKLLRKIMIRDGKQPKAASRLLGFVFGAVRGAVIVVVTFVMAVVIIPFGFAKPVVKTANKSIIGDFTAKYAYKAVDTVVYGKGTKNTEEIIKAAGFKLQTAPASETPTTA